MDDLRFHRAKVDEDLTITIGLAPDKPFPSWWHSGSAVTLTDVPTGDIYIGEIIDLHDCYRDGGEASYVWVQLR
jgi:hypothetical protein